MAGVGRTRRVVLSNLLRRPVKIGA
jgi:hypothetical protein